MSQLLILGFLIGIVISSVWNHFFDGYLNKVYKLSNYLEILEHYHHGLVLLILSLLFTYPANEILAGIGIELICDERFQENPFALGKEYFRYSLCLGFVLVTIFVLLSQRYWIGVVI